MPLKRVIIIILKSSPMKTLQMINKELVFLDSLRKLFQVLRRLLKILLLKIKFNQNHNRDHQLLVFTLAIDQAFILL